MYMQRKDGSVRKAGEKIKGQSKKVGSKKQNYISCCNYCSLVVTVVPLQQFQIVRNNFIDSKSIINKIGLLFQ